MCNKSNVSWNREEAKDKDDTHMMLYKSNAIDIALLL